MYHDYKPDNKKIIVIGKSIEDLTEDECDEVLEELIKVGTLVKDEYGNIYKPTFMDT
tara:strand:- start:261 stop:431 length:171 start_codon:yes stop_codon:yes gene_type:complete